MGTWPTIKWPQMIRGGPISAYVQIRNRIENTDR